MAKIKIFKKAVIFIKVLVLLVFVSILANYIQYKVEGKCNTKKEIDSLEVIKLKLEIQIKQQELHDN